MICTSCGRTVEEGMAFCPHCGAAVIQPFMTEEDKAREDAEAEAALKSLDEIKKTVAKPIAVPQATATAPISIVAPKRDFSSRRRDSRVGQVVIGLLAVLALAVMLFVVLPRFVKHYPSWTPTIAEKDPDETSAPIGEIPTIDELSGQDDPELEPAIIAYDAYEDPEKDKDAESSEGDSGSRKSMNGYVLPDSDTHLYTEEELEGYTEWELEIARNEIYARHGRGFNDSTLQSYFDAQEWYERKYSPEEFDAQTGILNETELANVATIGKVEESL